METNIDKEMEKRIKQGYVFTDVADFVIDDIEIPLKETLKIARAYFNNLIKMIKVNTPKIIFSLPEIDLRFIFFQSFNNELFILPNFQSNELIFAQEYFKK